MKKLLLTLVVSLAFCGSIFAQIPNPNGYTTHWPDFDYHAFTLNKGLVAAIMIDGEAVTVENEYWDDLEVSAWVDDVCRGVGLWLCDEYVLDFGDPYPATWGQPIYYRTPGEPCSFQMYNHVTGTLYTECAVMQDGEPAVVETGTYYDQGWDEDPSHIIWLCFTSPAGSGYTLDIDCYAEQDGKDNYYLIASPVTVSPAEVENMIEPYAYDLYYFDQAGDDEGKEWITYKESGTNPGFGLVPGKGYLYANAGDADNDITTVTLTFPVGNEYDGEGVVELAKVGGDFEGWNLVGNPFMETAYIDRDFYVMDKVSGELMASEESGILPMQGLFVEASEDGEEMTFTTTAPGKTSKLSLNLVSGNRLVDRAIVNFGGGSLSKFQINSDSPKLYIPMDGEDYAVVSSAEMGEVPVSFKAAKSGSYTLAVSTEVSFNYLHLIDNLTGADQDLLAAPSYSFEASTTDYANRFRLVFATGNSDDTFAFYSNGSFVISNEGEATVQVVDVTGRMLSSEAINGSASVSVDGAAGVYMIRLVNGESVKVQKVVVK